MWLFLATEIMFFTGLIGSYIVLRAGSPPASYSNLFPPPPRSTGSKTPAGVAIDSLGPDRRRPSSRPSERRPTGQDSSTRSRRSSTSSGHAPSRR